MVNAAQMTSETLAYATLGGLAIALLISIYTDIRYRLIFNKVNIAIAIGAPIFWLASGVVTTMIQTEKYDTPLASALRVLSAEFRNDRMMRAEEKAARLLAIMTVPLILFILPTLFIVILGPAACSIGDAFSK